MIRILFFGDIIGRIGRRALVRLLPKLKKELKADLVLANAENMAHGKGVTVDTLKEVMKAGVDYFTSGNHFWSKKEEVEKVLVEGLPIIRPANFSESFSGQGYAVFEVKRNKILLINLVGRIFTKIDDSQVVCPFRKVDEILSKFPGIKIKIVDFHAEATSEKTALGYYLDGRVSAMVGTHTHIPTADEKILPGGTAYVTDLGMVGPKDSVIGVEKQLIIDHFLAENLYNPVQVEIPKTGIVTVSGVLIEIDKKNGLAKKIKRIKKEIII